MAALSKYMSEARDRALPDAVIEEAKHHILDTFAAMVSGSELLPGREALKVRPGSWRREEFDDRRLATALRTDRSSHREW